MNTRALPSRLLAALVLLCALAQSSSPQSPTPTQTPAPASQSTTSQPATTQSTSPNPQAGTATTAQTPAQTRAPRSRLANRRYLEQNKLAPELYSDKLSMKLTLVDLPGASDPGSTWEGSYHLYFVSEADFEKAAGEVRKKAAASGVHSLAWNPASADFPEKILLAEGTISKKNLATLQQRVHLHENIAFKQRIPDALRTKGAHLLAAYSVKVYDAKLKTPVYASGIFNNFPFDDETDPDKIAPRTVVYVNFIVTPKGEINESKLPRGDGDTSWM